MAHILPALRSWRPKTSFFALPAEVRNEIYAYCTPVTGYSEQFKGLFLTSKQVKAEYEAEAIRTMTKFLFEIKKDWPHAQELRLPAPTTFHEIFNTTVEIPMSLYYPPFRSSFLERMGTCLEPCLAPLFSLYLSDITVKIYEDVDKTNLDLKETPCGLIVNIANMFVEEPAPRPRIPKKEGRRYQDFPIDLILHARSLTFMWVSSSDSKVHEDHRRVFRRMDMYWQRKAVESRVVRTSSPNQNWKAFFIKEPKTTKNPTKNPTKRKEGKRLSCA
ncbi:hypothetical protein BU26DRAFT_71486 [Trematosphaeria pertusa]|uniref:Uncharacterized protein n=1 Tax=Trematosphaeria pertusa TaxID=390896 RepID=A0A6A6I6K0_9PLEO|nr:uncharacterized protein BU26DRAFT_71486 [Trematosphaeria pertusa]KAF2245572.1 hypothetical protein BU26DRAFT_71486 [Trematosphaeria pertusa]